MLTYCQGEWKLVNWNEEELGSTYQITWGVGVLWLSSWLLETYFYAYVFAEWDKNKVIHWLLVCSGERLEEISSQDRNNLKKQGA